MRFIAGNLVYDDLEQLDPNDCPVELTCPISTQILYDPVVTDQGEIFSEQFILRALQIKADANIEPVSPLSGLPILSLKRVPEVRGLIAAWARAHKRHDILQQINASSQEFFEKTEQEIEIPKPAPIKIKKAERVFFHLAAGNIFVKILNCPLGDQTNITFLINQLADPVGNRPVKTLNSNADRTTVYRHSEGRWIQRQISDSRPSLKPLDYLYIKKTSLTKAPEDGRMYYFSHLYPVGILLKEENKLRAPGKEKKIYTKIKPHHIYAGNINSNNRQWIMGQPGNDQYPYVDATADEKIKELNHQNRLKGTIGNWNEYLGCPSKKALVGVFSHIDDLQHRLNALRIKSFIRQHLRIDLPLFIVASNTRPKKYTKEAQIRDVIEGLMMFNTFQFPNFAPSITQQLAEAALTFEEREMAVKENFNPESPFEVSLLVTRLIMLKHYQLAIFFIVEKDFPIDLYFDVPKQCNRPLHLAILAEENQPDLVRALCRKGADPALKNFNGKSAIDFSLEKKKYDLLEIMIFESGDKLDLSNITFILKTLLQAKAFSEVKSLFEKLLIQKPAIVPFLDVDLFHILISANENFSEIAKEFIRKGVDLIRSSALGSSAIDILLRNEALGLLDFIIQEVKTNNERSAILFCLLQAGCYHDNIFMDHYTLDPNYRDPQSKDSLLHAAVKAGVHYQNVALSLLGRGADVSYKDKHGFSSLSYAGQNKELQNLVENFIVHSESIVNAKEHGNILINLLTDKKYDIACQLLEKSDAINLEWRDRDGNNAFHLAVLAEAPQPQLIKFLCLQGSKSNVGYERVSLTNRNRAGKTPLQIIIEKKQPELLAVVILLKHKDLPKEWLSFIASFLCPSDSETVNQSLKIVFIARIQDLPFHSIEVIIKNLVKNKKISLGLIPVIFASLLSMEDKKVVIEILLNKILESANSCEEVLDILKALQTHRENHAELFSERSGFFAAFRSSFGFWKRLLQIVENRLLHLTLESDAPENAQEVSVRATSAMTIVENRELLPRAFTIWNQASDFPEKARELLQIDDREISSFLRR